MERHLAIMFADIADSTRLYERLGDERAVAITQQIIVFLKHVVASRGGTVVKSLGDGVLASFPSADAAVDAVPVILDGQQKTGLALRVGLHWGAVICRDGDVFGDACNVAARVEQICRPREVLATAALVEELSPARRRKTKALANVSVKGKTAPLAIHQVFRDDVEDDGDGGGCTVFVGDAPRTGAAGDVTLRLTYQGQTVVLDRASPRLVVGRGAHCGLCLRSPQTSREHASVEFSRESFIITDQSTNGTFIRAGLSPLVALRRDATKLVGGGMIGFGLAPAERTEDHVVLFQCMNS